MPLSPAEEQRITRLENRQRRLIDIIKELRQVVRHMLRSEMESEYTDSPLDIAQGIQDNIPEDPQ